MWTFTPTERRQLVNSRTQESRKLRATDCKILQLMVENSGHVVSKDKLNHAAWPDRVVSPANLPQAIAQLRSALGDTGREQQFIKTIPKQGYLLVEGIVTCADNYKDLKTYTPNSTSPKISLTSIPSSRDNIATKLTITGLSILLIFAMSWLTCILYIDTFTLRQVWQQRTYLGITYFFPNNNNGLHEYETIKDTYPENILMIYLSSNPEQYYISCIYTSNVLHERSTQNLSFNRDFSISQRKEAIREQCK
jgi:DNA-binding winged helix-turn-helix (wHTH) protein